MKVTAGLVASVACAAACACAAAGRPGFTATRGGLGGRVLRVTTLDADGAGSLRAALSEKGARVIVFEVGGVIDLQRRALKVAEPCVTVAGETAPSPGITLIRGGVTVQTHDVIMRHLRIRPGDAEQPKGKGWEPDGLSVNGAEGHDVIIDHCSLTWAVDENLSASGPRLDGPQATAHRVTFSNCIIAEGLSHATHAKGEHSKGSLIHDCCQEIAIIGNLYAHNMQRNPYFKAHCTGVIVNNLIYDPGTAAIQLNFVEKEWTGAAFAPSNCQVSIVGNVMIQGACTRRGLALVGTKGDAFLEDNLAFRPDGSPAPLVSGAVVRLAEKPVWPDGLRALAAAEVADDVVRHAGARPGDRDAVDRRIIGDFLARKGRIIDSQREVGGYPTCEPTARKLDVPAEGVEAWLATFADKVE